MNQLYKLPFRLLGYKAHRSTGWPRLLPVSLTFSVTNKCLSRCKTCNLWNFPSGEELTVEEWEKVFKSLGKQVMWITFSGGDQFLRKDFYKIVNQAVKLTKPCLINIPLSSKDVEETLRQVTEILKYSKTHLIINISLDGDEKVHEFIRGVKGGFEATIETFHRLKSLKKSFPQLSVCLNTVISEHNINKLDSLRRRVTDLRPDYWTIEPFQCRAEFGNADKEPDLDGQNLFFNIKSLDTNKEMSREGILKMKHMIRHMYYHFAEKTLQKNKSVIPCYAAIASAHVSPEGNVWQCGTKCSVLGNLRESDYDFKKIFFNKKADSIRKKIKEDKCFCIQCNSFYTSFMCNPGSLVRYFLTRPKG